MNYYQQDQQNQQNQQDNQEDEDRAGVFAYDKYCNFQSYVIIRLGQKKIWDDFDYEEYKKTQTSRFKKQQTQKLCTTLMLGEYRETQVR